MSENEYGNFLEMTMVQKINIVDQIIEEDIRGFLVRDNGDCDLINVEEKNGHFIVYIEYQGACVSCPASGGTLMSIQNILQRKLSDQIRVVSV